MPLLNLSPEDCLSVTDLTRDIKAVLESNFGALWVRGEISNLRRQQSGHVYFSLKDQGAMISCVCFRADAARIEVALRDGQQVRAFGRLNIYEPRGSYQLVLRTIEPDGEGRLQLRFLELKQRLGDEGLFDQDRKRPLPRLPRSVAFVTSDTGAALRDFISVLNRRQWAGQLFVIPARVQGNEAAGEIVAGIKLANRLSIADLIVVGRGGGSIEDLWPFNEEIVARAIAASSLPVISAVGHEIDFTLSDFAADYRAATPTAAAEWICSSREDLLNRYRNSLSRLDISTRHALDRKGHHLKLLQSDLRRLHPQNRLEQANLRLDDLHGRLGNALEKRLRNAKQAFQIARTQFAGLHPERQLAHARKHLQQVQLRLENASHRSALKRGYAILRHPSSGRVISDQEALAQSAAFIVEVRDGSFTARRNS